jgi:hypothetical protein
MVRGRNLLLAPHGKRALVAGDTEFLLLNLTKRDFSPSAAAFAPLIEKSTVTAGQDFRITEDEQSVVGEVQEQDGAKFHTLTIKPSAEPEDTVVFSADGEWMFVPQLGEETTIHQISLPDLKQRRTLAIPKAGSCKLMYAAGAIGIWSSNKNELWLVDERDLQVKQVFRMLDRKPFATAPDAPLLFIYAEQLFVVDLQSGQTLEGCDLKALADQVPTRKGSFPLEIQRPLRVSGDGKEIYARSRLLRWDGKQITLDLDHSVFNADGRIVWNRTHKEWRALAVIPTLTGEESQVGYYNSMSPRHRVATLDLSSNRMPDIFFLPGDTDAFGVPGTRNRLELYRLSDGKRESYSMPNRFSIDTIFPAASGRQALVIGSRQLVWAEFPVVLGDPPR